MSVSGRPEAEIETAMRVIRSLLVAAAAIGALVAIAGAASAGSDGQHQFVVVYKKGASLESARAAVAASGGKIISENRAIGVATVRAKDASFQRQAARQPALAGAASDRAIGRAPGSGRKRDGVEELRHRAARIPAPEGPVGPAETSSRSSGLQWDMKMIGATPDGSYAASRAAMTCASASSTRASTARHPDIAPNFDASLSRNFTVDDPLIDGACDTDPDGSCDDPAERRRGRPRHPRREHDRLAAQRRGHRRRRAEASTSSTCAPARTRASSSCSPPSTR